MNARSELISNMPQWFAAEECPGKGKCRQKV